MEQSVWTEPRFWVAVAFVIFFVLFGRKLWTVIAGLLDARIARIRAELDEAQKLRREAEAMLVDARKRREDALKDAKSLLAVGGRRGEARGRGGAHRGRVGG